MEIKTVEECFYHIQNGANIKQGVLEGGYPITRIETISNNIFNRDKMGYAGIVDIDPYISYVLEDGDLLMSHINSVRYLGRTILYERQGNEKIIHGMNLLRLKADRSLINPSFARYYFYSHDFREQIRKITKKSVNQASFAISDLKKITIRLPELSKQKEITNILDNVNKVIKLYMTQIQKMDALIKSRFVEMFGSCENMLSIADLCSIITDGTHQPPKFRRTGIPFIFVSNLVENKVTYNAEKFISEDTYNELIKRTPIEKGDILLSTVGSYGHPAVVIEDKKFLFQRHIAYMKPKHNVINSFYLHSALLAPDAQRQIEERVKGIAQKTLNLSEIRKIMLPVPSMESQNEFEQFVHQIDKLKFEAQENLEKAQLLFDSLMQQYFG